MDSTAWQRSDYWSTFFGQFWIELIGGTIAALIFLFLVLYFFKPKIRICHFLCKTSVNQQTVYIFKFVNKSFFSAHDIKVELYKIRKIPMGKGEYNNQHEILNIINGNISHIPRRPFFWQKQLHHPHCIVVRSFDDLNTILAEDANGIILRVSLKHGLTGLSNVFEQEYGNESDIKNGKYKPGTKFGSI